MTYTVFHETSEVRSHSVVTRTFMTLKELVFLKCIYMVFVSPAKQKRDICTAFPASSLSSSSLSSSSSSSSAA